MDDVDLEWQLVEVFDDAPRLSPAARRFMSGEMPREEAVALGYLAEGDAWQYGLPGDDGLR